MLKSKEWFDWESPFHSLEPGTPLSFKTSSSYRFKAKGVYASVEVEGAAYIIGRDGSKPQKVATIFYSSEGPSKGNPVVEYLRRVGTPVGATYMFPTGGYTLKDEGARALRTPSSNQAYSDVSGDYNSIHTNPYFADLASLPGTITHGMWSSASTRAVVERVAAEGQGDRVRSYEVAFTGMLLPNTELKVDIKHVGQTAKGNKLFSVTTWALPTESSSDAEPTKVIVGTAEVAQPPTAYVFTGQGSQEKGMGMALYAESADARAVWDEADAHLQAHYGFSILHIVRDDPKDVVIHFGGLRGHEVRRRYMEMTYQTTDADGNVQTLPLFPDIDLRTNRYVFSSPTTALALTQFSQVALVVTEKAAFDDLRAKGLVDPSAVFAGHSLGEYSALAAIASVMGISALTDVVFFRGITMQRAVQRDDQNRSKYAMAAVNPSRIGKSFTDAALREVVEAVDTRTGSLLQIVKSVSFRCCC